MGITSFVEPGTNETAQYLSGEDYDKYFLLLTQLKAALASDKRKFVQFLVEYHGSGDSGDYEPAELSIDTGETVPPSYHYTTIMADEVLTKDLINLLSDFIVEKINYDWYNNDGGGGTAYINLADGVFGWDGWYNVTEQHPDANSFKISD